MLGNNKKMWIVENKMDFVTRVYNEIYGVSRQNKLLQNHKICISKLLEIREMDNQFFDLVNFMSFLWGLWCFWWDLLRKNLFNGSVDLVNYKFIKRDHKLDSWWFIINILLEFECFRILKSNLSRVRIFVFI